MVVFKVKFWDYSRSKHTGSFGVSKSLVHLLFDQDKFSYKFMIPITIFLNFVEWKRFSEILENMQNKILFVIEIF